MLVEDILAQKGGQVFAVAPDCRAPLETIVGLAECVADGVAASSAQDDYRREIEETGRRLLSIIDDVTTLSRLQLGALDPARETFGAAELATGCATEFLPQADKKALGLGLALVEAMMLAHGGSLILESRLGIGTTATLCFPAVDAAAEPAPNGRLHAA
ncbi:MAG TPA: histidine kinase dimerization/phospho-acceptor domain-containing protein [Stellaceae bacterium]|jgi:signal transduction histidine kinase